MVCGVLAAVATPDVTVAGVVATVVVAQSQHGDGPGDGAGASRAGGNAPKGGGAGTTLALVGEVGRPRELRGAGTVLRALPQKSDGGKGEIRALTAGGGASSAKWLSGGTAKSAGGRSGPAAGRTPCGAGGSGGPAASRLPDTTPPS